VGFSVVCIRLYCTVLYCTVLYFFVQHKIRNYEPRINARRPISSSFYRLPYILLTSLSLYRDNFTLYIALHVQSSYSTYHNILKSVFILGALHARVNVCVRFCRPERGAGCDNPASHLLSIHGTLDFDGILNVELSLRLLFPLPVALYRLNRISRRLKLVFNLDSGTKHIRESLPVSLPPRNSFKRN
jgi:hypothetical protein